jgi:putative transposase
MIRTEQGISVTRFCELVGVPRASYYRRRRRETGDGLVRGPWPSPVLDRIDPLVAEVAASFGFFGYRKVWGRLRLDGQEGISASSVRRSMGRQGLLQPRRYQAERRALAQARKAVFVTPPVRRNRLWQLDWTEFETLAGGSWNYAPIVDYWAKVALAASASPTKTTQDAVLAIEAAIAEVERLLGRTLREECVHPSTGELEPLVIVTDNGACFRSGGFQRFIDSRPELAHVRTRVKAPETNGVVERWIESSKYERLYREEIPDGLALQAQLDDYRDFYNTVRPHETLDQTLPISRYLAKQDNNETEEANLEPAESVSDS